MLKKIITTLFCICLLLIPLDFNYADAAVTTSFNGAEGGGALAGANLNTTTYHVTNLNDSGSGSFRDAVSKSNRTVVFDVSGQISLKSVLHISSNIIINGQTSKNGITLADNSVSLSGSKNIVMRYLRVRQGLKGGQKRCSLVMDKADTIMVDHVSIEFGRWDNLNINNSSNITIQNSIIADPIVPQLFGAIIQASENLTISHCLWANNQSRNPKAKANMQFVNNVVYNWKKCGFVGGHSSADHHQDLIGNYFIAGPNSAGSNFIGECTSTDHIYIKNNYVDGNKDKKLNGRLISDNDITSRHATLEKNPYIKMNLPLTIDTPENAYNKIINDVGDSIHRDSIDNTIINQVMSLGTEGEMVSNPATMKINNKSTANPSPVNGTNTSSTTTQQPSTQNPSTQQPSTPSGTTTTNKSNLKLDYSTNNWGSGYQVNFTITNQSSAAINTWTLKVKKSDIQIDTQWNVNLKEEGDYYVITPVDWNSKIEKGASVSFGVQGSKKINKTINYVLS